ncbi:MAG: hypothetical protein ACRDG8_08960 [Actinomycetota bacterium]
MLARRRRFEAAEREGRENVALAEETDWPGYTGMAWFDLVILHLAGRNEEAAEAARRSEEFLARKGSVVMLGRATALREQLEAAR